MKTTSVTLDAIRIDGGTQARAELNQMTVAEYADAMAEGAKFPPVVVFFDGVDNWLADGFHRYFGAKKINARDIEVDVRDGTKRDAVLFSIGANASHGLRRTNADKRKAVETLLADPEWASWSDNQIAKACGVSHPFVGSVRASLETVSSEKTAERSYTTKHGTTATMKTGNVGRTKEKPEQTAEKPQSPAPAAPSISSEDQELADAMGADPVELLNDLQRENEALLAQIKTLTAEDTKAELHKMILQRDHAVREQEVAMDRAHKEQRLHAQKHRALMRCGKAVGEDDPTKIAATVEAFVRSHGGVPLKVVA